MDFRESYMHRCISLALLGAGKVAPNPMVGSVLVHNDRIIGEGYHQLYGKPHAEVNCIQSVAPSDRHLIPESTLYVSLEPCAHFGKTPPCANLIISEKIPKVVIGSKDPFEQVNGKGIGILQQAGVEVIQGVLEKECDDLNKRFFTFHQKQRPYIILKWAQTSDNKIDTEGSERLLISNGYTNRLVHKWRSEEAGILVGTNTALIDDPKLSNRLWSGNQPVRMVIDMENKLPAHLHLFDQSQPTIVFNSIKEEDGPVRFVKISDRDDLIPQLLNALYRLKIQSVIIEGGTKTIQSFIEHNAWDEARIITNMDLRINKGLSAPVLNHSNLLSSQMIGQDLIQTFIQ